VKGKIEVRAESRHNHETVDPLKLPVYSCSPFLDISISLYNQWLLFTLFCSSIPFPFSTKRTHTPLFLQAKTLRNSGPRAPKHGGEAAHAPESGANDRRLPALLIAPYKHLGSFVQAIRKGLHIGLSYLAISASSFQGCRPLTEIGAIGPILTNMCKLSYARETFEARYNAEICK
jgi:hypothetical protein